MVLDSFFLSSIDDAYSLSKTYIQTYIRILLPKQETLDLQKAKAFLKHNDCFTNIINDHTAITPEMALRLEKAFGMSRQTWLTMQQRYDLWRAEQRADLS